MSEILPPGNVAVVYNTAEEAMLLRIIDGSLGPGLVSLGTLRQLSAKVEAELAKRIATLEGKAYTTPADLTAEAKARKDADDAEIAARTAAVSAEAKARSDADTAEATTRANADNTITAKLPIQLESLTISENIAVAVGAGVRRVTVTTPAAWGVAAGQNLVAFATSVPSTAYAVHDVIATGPNTVSVAISTPALALLATYSITCRVVRVAN